MKVLAYLLVLSTAVAVAAPKKQTIKKTKTKVATEKTTMVAPARTETAPASENPSVGESSAAMSSATSTALETVMTVPSEAKITGGVELRPGFKGVNGSFLSENWAALGYQFNKNLETGYLQYFDSNVYSPSGTTNGLGLIAQDGFVKLRMSNLLNNGQGLSFGYEPRVYLPTNAERRDRAGMIAVVRNYLKLTQQLSSAVSVTLFDIPMFHAYSQRGYVDAKGSYKANPDFENRVYLVTDINVTEKLAISLPILYEAKRNTNFSPLAVRNNAWAHNFYVWPEVNYQATPNLAVGVAYYSDNLLGAIDGSDATLSKGYNLSASTVGNGFKNGVTQLILRASL